MYNLDIIYYLIIRHYKPFARCGIVWEMVRINRGTDTARDAVNAFSRAAIYMIGSHKATMRVASSTAQHTGRHQPQRPSMFQPSFNIHPCHRDTAVDVVAEGVNAFKCLHSASVVSVSARWRPLAPNFLPFPKYP